MTQPTQVTVVAADLTKHADHLEQAGADLASAKAAGDQIRLGAGAYGQLCVVVPVLIDSLQNTLIDALAAGFGSMHETSDRLRQVADAYRSTDHRNSQAITTAGGGP